jgi:hypothetical protein
VIRKLFWRSGWHGLEKPMAGDVLERVSQRDFDQRALDRATERARIDQAIRDQEAAFERELAERRKLRLVTRKRVWALPFRPGRLRPLRRLPRKKPRASWWARLLGKA